MQLVQCDPSECGWSNGRSDGATQVLPHPDAVRYRGPASLGNGSRSQSTGITIGNCKITRCNHRWPQSKNSIDGCGGRSHSIRNCALGPNLNCPGGPAQIVRDTRVLT